eukprot:Clim_evm36s158 gene=Clim_evmTU36s158
MAESETRERLFAAADHPLKNYTPGHLELVTRTTGQLIDAQRWFLTHAQQIMLEFSVDQNALNIVQPCLSTNLAGKDMRNKLKALIQKIVDKYPASVPESVSILLDPSKEQELQGFVTHMINEGLFTVIRALVEMFFEKINALVKHDEEMNKVPEASRIMKIRERMLGGEDIMVAFGSLTSNETIYGHLQFSTQIPYLILVWNHVLHMQDFLNHTLSSVNLFPLKMNPKVTGERGPLYFYRNQPTMASDVEVRTHIAAMPGDRLMSKALSEPPLCRSPLMPQSYTGLLLGDTPGALGEHTTAERDDGRGGSEPYGEEFAMNLLILKAKMHVYAQRAMLENVDPEVLSYLAACIDDQLREIFEALGHISNHREERLKEVYDNKVVSDPRAQLQLYNDREAAIQKSQNEQLHRRKLQATAGEAGPATGTKAGPSKADKAKLDSLKSMLSVGRKRKKPEPSPRKNTSAMPGVSRLNGVPQASTRTSGRGSASGTARVSRIRTVDLTFMMQHNRYWRKSPILYEALQASPFNAMPLPGSGGTNRGASSGIPAFGSTV